ncbi:MAG: SPFH domain-containing protein [Alphaproteobacteria bacterium]|nr:SPFH domain-containing protein [Alphaproteobacteria bacterium]
MTNQDIKQQSIHKEKTANTISGFIILAIMGSLILAIGFTFYADAIQSKQPPILSIMLILPLIFMGVGLFIIKPNTAKALMLFGSYAGTVKQTGFHWANPFYFEKHFISLRVRNFNSDTLKVNDQTGNPIEIGAVVVWKVVNTSEALFEVDNYEDYVTIQTEAALRDLAVAYPYEQHEGDEIALRSHSAEIAEKLKIELQNRLAMAGVEVVEARISHLAYAPEIASAMLQRQQASAILAARKLIVTGAVSIVDEALKQLSENNIVELDEERKAAMVSNLLVVLCSENNAQPVVNAGSLY